MHSPQTITQQPSRAVVAAILEQENLPATDLTDLHLKTFFYAGPSDAPAAIRSTREFARLCPASSAFMFKRL
jgi:hypothetical protein